MMTVLRDFSLAATLTTFSWAVAFGSAKLVLGPTIVGNLAPDVKVNLPAEYVVFLTTFTVCGWLVRQYVKLGQQEARQ